MLDFNLQWQTEKVLIRPLVPKDFIFFEKLTADPSMWIYFTSDLSVKVELQKWIEDSINEMNNKTRLPFAILDKQSNAAIGSTSFGNISYRDKRIEIGWTWIGKDYQGTGINKQIKCLMAEYVFEKLDFERLEFKTDVLNTPARKALLRFGAKEEGVLRSHTLMTHNRRRDTIFYSILKSEWEEVKSKNCF